MFSLKKIEIMNMCHTFLDQIKAKAYYYIAHVSPTKVLLCFIIITLIIVLTEQKICKVKSSWYFIVSLSAYFTVLITITLMGRAGQVDSSIEDIFLSYKILSTGDINIIYDIIFNIILFVPIGVLFGMKMKNLVAFLCVLTISFAIEFVQLVSKRGLFEISDLINNAIGGEIGIVFMCGIKKLKQKIRDVQK